MACDNSDCDCKVTVSGCEHSFAKLNDRAIFCQKCGDIHDLVPQPQQPAHVCLPCALPHYPCQRVHYDYIYTTTTSPNTTTF